MSDDEWMKAAGEDYTMVAELLLRLKDIKPNPPSPTPPKPGLSLEWSVRQRRSKAVIVGAKKQAPRSSPTTPLSWSGATSTSGGGFGGGGGSGSGGAYDGGPDEESSRLSPPPPQPKRSDTTRSKVIIGTSEPSSSKRSRRKKTLAELKEEEDLLQKEKRQLKRQLATLRLNLEDARATNENLKRMKFDLQAPLAPQRGSLLAPEIEICARLQQKIDPIPVILTPIVAGNAGSIPCSSPNGCSEGKNEVTAAKFVLPDLNLPFEEASSADILSRVS